MKNRFNGHKNIWRLLSLVKTISDLTVQDPDDDWVKARAWDVLLTCAGNRDIDAEQAIYGLVTADPDLEMPAGERTQQMVHEACRRSGLLED